MAGLVVILLGVSLIFMRTVQCNEDIASVNKRIDGVDKDIVLLESGLLRVKERLQHQINSAKVSLKSELKQHISEFVREAIAVILQGESAEEMVRSQVVTEVRQLRRGNHQMKGQLHRVLMSLRDVQEEMNTYKEALVQVKKDSNEKKVCSEYIIISEIVKRDLDKCKIQTRKNDRHVHKNEEDIIEIKRNLKVLNQICHVQLKEVNTSKTTTQVVTSTTGSITSTTSIATTPTTSPSTTIKSEEQRSRIIIAPIWSSTPHQFRQLNIPTNTVSTYQLPSLKNVASVAYVSKLKKLLIGLYSPRRIVSSNLDSNGLKTIRQNVRTYGMAVDEEREIVFLTTYQPRYTISRMTTQGKHFTEITELSNYGHPSYPRAIAVNTKQRMIYASRYNELFSVSYDGRGLQTLATGIDMYAVTLDNKRSILYYNVEKTLMRMSLSDSVVTNVTTLNATPWTIAYYRDTVYYSSWNSNIDTIGAVDVGYNIVSNTLQTVSVKGVYTYAICLVPETHTGLN